jgi:hypothetical protein
MPDCVSLVRYRTCSGIVSFFQSGTGLTVNWTVNWYWTMKIRYPRTRKYCPFFPTSSYLIIKCRLFIVIHSLCKTVVLNDPYHEIFTSVFFTKAPEIFQISPRIAREILLQAYSMCATCSKRVFHTGADFKQRWRRTWVAVLQ